MFARAAPAHVPLHSSPKAPLSSEAGAERRPSALPPAPDRWPRSAPGQWLTFKDEQEQGEAGVTQVAVC